MGCRASHGQLRSALLRSARTVRATAGVAEQCAITARDCHSEDVAMRCERLASQALMAAEHLAWLADVPEASFADG
jgi:hypothetical protein